MWKERLSGQSTPSGLPPARHRSQSPAPRGPPLLAPSGSSGRPGYSPRSSSLSLISNASTSSLPAESNLINGSALKQSHVPDSPVDITDPLDILERILRLSSVESSKFLAGTSATSERQNGRQSLQNVTNTDFGTLSLAAFAEEWGGKDRRAGDHATYELKSVEEFEVEKDAFEELHESITGCDDVLKSVELYLSSFQADLGAVSAEIECLQNRSVRINTRLENRVSVESLLGPTVEEVSLSPEIVRRISEGPVDDQWVLALAEVEKRFRVMETTSREANRVKALADLRPLFTNLINKAVEMIRDFLVSQIRALRSPDVNAQVVQTKSLLKHKDSYTFLTRHNAQLAEEIAQAYINTMRWYYLNHFSRYRNSLEKMRLHVMDKSDVLAQGDSSRKASKEPAKAYDVLNLGKRIDVLKPSAQLATPAHLAEESSLVYYVEMPFRNFNLALMDNASAEYSFLTGFFTSQSFHQVSRKFAEIFGPTFDLGQKLTKSLVEANTDCLGVLLCVRLNQLFAFEVQRRKVPVLDSYINGTNMLLWPRFQIIMDLHCESVRKATALTSGRATTALSLTGTDPAKQSAAPHFLTQRFGQLIHSILTLSGEAGDDEPISNSLRRLRTDFEAFLTKSSRSISDGRKRERFIVNNYSLISTIISDTTGRLAEEQESHFEKLKSGSQDGL